MLGLERNGGSSLPVVKTETATEVIRPPHWPAMFSSASAGAQNAFCTCSHTPGPCGHRRQQAW